jgi:hypothetical protein
VIKGRFFYKFKRMKYKIYLAIPLCAILFSGCSPAEKEKGNANPNIIFILADVGYGDLGFYG